MATITRRELVDLAATNIGALAAGQVLADDDLDFIDQQCAALIDQLAEDEILYITDEQEIPASWSPYLASLLSNLIAPNYGGPFSNDTKVINEAILRKLVRAKETREPLQVDYF
jgi:hypothetical protein